MYTDLFFYIFPCIWDDSCFSKRLLAITFFCTTLFGGDFKTFCIHIGSLILLNSLLQLRKMLDLLVHASQCRSAHCQYPNCRKVKGLFRHGMHCKTRASGGCVLCKKMWYLLQLHARACKESECHVPRCRFVDHAFSLFSS